ncbi:MAG: 4Fe-4S dicluster domain-containing protein [Lachnospiraceae bacterium]|nr:4Fe-4S dicluster domain-containing protein [Lachnospiraceae bacterium]
MLKIAVNEINRLFDAIAAVENLYLPVEKGGEVEFGAYSADAKVRLDALQTVKSAKDMFFPFSENLMKFHVEGKQISVEAAEKVNEEFVVFGVRACDARSFSILDKVFLADPVDTYYAARREHGVVVSMACSRPEETCFCSAFGIDATKPEGDVVTWVADGVLYWEAQTEKGAALTEKVAEVLAESDSAAVEAQQAAVKAIMEKLPLAGLDLSYFTSRPELEIFKRPEWTELSSHCLGCGTCTFVCPTCQCYDVRDFDNGHGIERYRCWDSCMYRDFTMMAHGTNRKTQVERFRQRFMHKLVYNPKNRDGEFGCVGCGRCLKKCPVNMNIVKVAKTLSAGGEQA